MGLGGGGVCELQQEERCGNLERERERFLLLNASFLSVLDVVSTIIIYVSLYRFVETNQWTHL